MREIKFRGKHVETEKWVYGFYEELVYAFEGKKTYISQFSDWGLNIRLEVKPETVGQYTGLKDKNGKEIYEGDIIWLGWYDKKTGAKTVTTIEWNDSRPPIGFSGLTDSMWGEPDSFYSRKPLFEVIGNIYENPELLADKAVKGV